MANFNFDPFITALRVRRGSIPQDLYNDLIAAAEASKAGVPVRPPLAAALSPVPWVGVAGSMLGLREIPGPKHNPKVLEMWQAAKASWIKDDESAWCGAFMALCVVKCGIMPPKDALRAISWADWGKWCPPQYGAIGVKARKGGNHVYQLVGITADGVYYKARGGNQNNMVSDTDILVKDTFAIRWPASQPLLNIKLPVLPRGTSGASEA